jgi:hypothetical protein
MTIVADQRVSEAAVSEAPGRSDLAGPELTLKVVAEVAIVLGCHGFGPAAEWAEADFVELGEVLTGFVNRSAGECERPLVGPARPEVAEQLAPFEETLAELRASGESLCPNCLGTGIFQDFGDLTGELCACMT